MKYQQIDFANVKFTYGLLADRIKLITDTVIPYQYELLNDKVKGATKSYAVRNFKLAAKVLSGKVKKAQHKGFVFQDSDIAKWLEAASFSLANKPDENLEQKCDKLIDLVAKAQLPDGYVNTFFTLTGKKRWSNLCFDHELYCAGHFIEAAVAYYQSTGKDKFLKVMCRYADFINKTFGRKKGQKRGYPGHQEAELALFKLYKLTGEKKYLDTAKYFIDERGRRYKGKLYFQNEKELKKRTSKVGQMLNSGDFSYCQAHLPVRQQKTVEGHAVRSMYMLCAMADIAGQTNDKQLLKACKTMWRNLVDRRMYITGGIGSTAVYEGFTKDYDLPNHTAYAETCASIGLIFWANRMLNIELNGEYADIIERALYNCVLSSVGLDGKHFFYSNRLASDPSETFGDTGTAGNIKTKRPEWFGCACCPPNLARLLCSLGSYAYSFSDNEICAHIYGSSKANLKLKSGDVQIEQKTDYPWHEKISIIVKPKKTDNFTIRLRIPGWCRKPKVKINNKNISVKTSKGYLAISRKWENSDKIELVFPMPVEMMRSHPAVVENIGRIAIQRGPIVYCLEQADNGKDIDKIVIPKNTKFSVKYDKKLLGGCCVIKTGKVKAIPYHLWANRKTGKMMVWICSK